MKLGSRIMMENSCAGKSYLGPKLRRTPECSSPGESREISQEQSLEPGCVKLGLLVPVTPCKYYRTNAKAHPQGPDSLHRFARNFVEHAPFQSVGCLCKTSHKSQVIYPSATKSLDPLVGLRFRFLVSSFPSSSPVSPCRPRPAIRSLRVELGSQSSVFKHRECPAGGAEGVPEGQSTSRGQGQCGVFCIFRGSLRAINAAFAKKKALPQAPASHHRGICQDKNLTTSIREPLPRHLQDKNLTTSIREPLPRHLQNKNLTTSTCEPSPRHLPRQKPYQKHLRTITAAFAKPKTLPEAPANQTNLTTSW